MILRDGTLPTYNSNAIEAGFVNLPNDVADCFIYLNDDFFFGKAAKKETFYKDGRMVIQMSKSIAPNLQKSKKNVFFPFFKYFI